MDKFCVNTGEVLTKKCTRETCVHFYRDSSTMCLQHVYLRPLTALDVAHMESMTYIDSRRIQKLAETKIIAWSKVLDRLDTLQPTSFISFLETLHALNETLAEDIANNPYLCIVKPMRYIKSELWLPVLQEFHNLMLDSGIATQENKTTWQYLLNHGILGD